MPRSDKLRLVKGKQVNYHEIASRQFQQQILPAGLPQTSVWSYGAAALPGTVFQGGSFHYPALTIESKFNTPTRVKWINGLVDSTGNYLPHLLPIDQTLHWANPGNVAHGMDPTPYTGPVPLVTHVHGAHTTEYSDGYAEAWFLPAGNHGNFTPVGPYYTQFKNAAAANGLGTWDPGTATFEYPNDQRAATLWYHDHTLGMTRANVYAGPAGFYLLRGGPGDLVLDTAGRAAVLPGPAPALGDAAGTAYFEIPIAIQDRSFNFDGSLFYPDSRFFFDQAPPEFYRPAGDIPPIWNPEFFGNMMVVNGRTWPFLDVQQRRYRFRFLNGCNSRFLILRFDRPGLQFWQIGAEGGFLPAPVALDELLIAPAERADVIVDFSALPAGTTVTLVNVGPDEPFGGGIPGVDFISADPDSTGQVMQFRVKTSRGVDMTTPPTNLVLPAAVPLPAATQTRQVTLNELVSGLFDGPVAARLGVFNGAGESVALEWMDDVTEMPTAGTTEMWEIHNFTEDAHPIHLHQVMFEVIERQAADGTIHPPEAWETGAKDTVIAYPGEITRIRARFDIAGRFVWHCHIVEHEDNDMMRPLQVLPAV
jgi:FtsP/CotA-like multicopper oxidase with cupredoxin domain